MAGLGFIAISHVQKGNMEKIAKKNVLAGMALLVIIGQVLDKSVLFEKYKVKIIIYEFQELELHIIIANACRKMFLYRWI